MPVLAQIDAASTRRTHRMAILCIRGMKHPPGDVPVSSFSYFTGVLEDLKHTFALLRAEVCFKVCL